MIPRSETMKILPGESDPPFRNNSRRSGLVFSGTQPSLQGKAHAMSTSWPDPRNHRRIVSGVSLMVALLLEGSLAMATGMAPPPDPDIPRRGTFFEPIQSVVRSKIPPIQPTDGAVSIPYTRIDVALVDGIAFTRLLQVYHNHDTSNQGYAFTMPLEQDRQITGFTLWDRGRRLVGSIEERTRAEQAYKEVTGDEAPEMRRDPGLVRQTQNRFELRVFPITPGENKQIELVSHRRLPLVNGKFELTLPIARLTGPWDDRHGAVRSQVTEVSIYVKDRLRLVDLEVSHGRAEIRKLDDRRRLIRVRFNQKVPEKLVLRYGLELDSPISASSLTFSEGAENFFNTRILFQAPDSKTIQKPTTGQRSVYLGVWRAKSELIHKKQNRPEQLLEEFLGMLTFLQMDKSNRFQISWRPLRLSDSGKMNDFFPPVATSQPLPFQDLFKEISQSFQRQRASGGKDATEDIDLVGHLRGATGKGGCDLVYLILGKIDASQWKKLTELIRQRPKIHFILLGRKALEIPEILELPNVSSYAIDTGWQRIRHSYTGRINVLQSRIMAELGLAKLSPRRLAELWSKLPNLSPAVPQVRVSGPVDLIQVAVDTGNRWWSGQKPKPGQMGILWLSGTFSGSGTASVEIVNPFNEQQDWTPAALMGTPTVTTLKADLKLEPGNRASRFVGALHARPQVEMLNSRIAWLDGTSRRQGKSEDATSETLTELAGLRAKVVKLSKRFSFISSETAFIALPKDLQKRYGFTPQQFGTAQMYDLKGMSKGGIPEPEEWLLLLLGSATLIFLAMRRRKVTARANLPRPH